MHVSVFSGVEDTKRGTADAFLTLTNLLLMWNWSNFDLPMFRISRWGSGATMSLRAFPGNDVVAKQLHWIFKHNQLSFCREKYGKQWKQQKIIYSSPYNSIMKTGRETADWPVGYNGKLCIALVSSIKCDKWMQNTIDRFDLRKFPAFGKRMTQFYHQQSDKRWWIGEIKKPNKV